MVFALALTGCNKGGSTDDDDDTKPSSSDSSSTSKPSDVVAEAVTDGAVKKFLD